MSGTTKLTLFGALAIALAATAWLTWQGAGEEPTATPQALALPQPASEAEATAEKRAAAAAALAHIAAESAAEQTFLPAEAPPGFEPAPPAPASAPQPPPGHSFTAFHGEMKTGRMTAADYPSVADAESADGYEWVSAASGVGALAAQGASANGRNWSFGWIGATPAADVERIAEALPAFGGEMLGRSGRLLRSRLPADAAQLRRIAELPGVAGIAPTPQAAKTAAQFLELAASRPLEQTPAFVTLMSDDPDGVWRQALSDLGAVVGRFDPDTRAYAANVPHSALSALIAADFVLAVEPVGILRPAHDTAVPAMGADALRRFDAATRLFSGSAGASVPVGVLDTGLNIHHADIASGRASICGANFVPGGVSAARDEDRDLWVDVVGHGTHVTGTIVGNGAVEARYAGMAPLARHIRFGKVLGHTNSTTAVAIGQGIDFLAEASSCGGEAAKPLVVNMSLGRDGLDWEGRTADERKLDATVWRHRQVYVVAAGNSDFRGRGDYASAKNALTVGAATREGDIASFSSQGPTLDGRLRPQIVGTGVRLVSAAGSGSRRGYAESSGTSMSSPAVAGVAALLMDAVPEFREQPAAVRARLIASAIRPDAFLDDTAKFPLHAGDGPGELQNQYGLGKVSARTSVLSRDSADGWTTGSATLDLGDGEYGYQDIEVPEGASRLDIALTWDEPPADTLAQPMLNDLDLWVDRGADCPETQPAACGNAASRSSRDNVEWLILRNPIAGLYRLKVVPKYARVQTPRAGLAWTVIRGPSTPRLSVAVAEESVAAPAGAPFAVNLTVSTDGYVAAGTMLRVDCRSANDAPGLPNSCARIEQILPRGSSASREDDLERPLTRESGDRIAIGEVAAGEEQTVRLLFRGSEEAENLHLYFTATAWNASAGSASVAVAVGESDAASPTVANVPANDDFAAATVLRGEAGAAEFDLLLATPEPGEPPYARGLIDDRLQAFLRPQQSVRPRSIWYAWTAPRTGVFRFGIAPSALDDFADEIQLDVFEVRRGDALASLTSFNGRSGGGTSFQAQRGRDYRIRLSILASNLLPPVDPFGAIIFAGDEGENRRRVVVPLSLAWGAAGRPSNDDFQFAARLDGASGSTSGSNLGATAERGEALYRLAGSTWHRWTAPASGDWTFSVNRSRLSVAAFVGDAVDDLRLVSGLPGQSVAFPAREGLEYSIVVAAEDAFGSGSDFVLDWAQEPRPFFANDDVATAEPLPASPAALHASEVDFGAMTVEPGEPPASGTRTAWWRWTAPVDGDFTWQMDTEWIALRLCVFSGESTADLALAACTGDDGTSARVSFPARAGQPYLLSAGLPIDGAFEDAANGPSRLRFAWGQAPGNDHFASAGALAGAAGAVRGSNEFATVESGERTGVLGDASTWWIWEAPAAAWFRFSLAGEAGVGSAGTLAVYRIVGDGMAGLEEAASGRQVAVTTDASLRTEAGVRYAIRIGSGDVAGPYALTWNRDGPPAWLRYLGRIRDGEVDSAGRVLSLSAPNALAFNADGSQLFVATASGLQTFGRNAGDGALEVAQALSGTGLDAALWWDATASTLLAGSCDGWLAYAASEDGALLDGRPLEGVVPCGGAMLWDATGSFLHVATPGLGILTFALDAERSAFAFLGAEPVSGLTAAVLSPADDFLYAAAAPGVLHVFARDPATGALTLAGTLSGDEDASASVDSSADSSKSEDSSDGVDAAEAVPVQEALADVRLLAVDADNRYLLAFGRGGLAPAALDLQTPTMPELLASTEAFTRGWATSLFSSFLPGCRFVAMRSQTLAADVVCIDSAYSVRLNPAARLLRPEDDVFGGGQDRFGNDLPFYYSLDGGVAASPDGKHIYVSDDDALLLFERVGSR